MKKFALALVCLVAGAVYGFGIIFPPDLGEKEISYSELPVIPYEAELSITIDDNFVVGELKQTFYNPRRFNEEGVFNFILPEGTSVIGFATWDGPTRIPGVILEKKKAIRTYEELRARAIDPGILLPAARNLFTAKIVPIPPRSTKMLELVFAGLLPEVDGKVRFVLPFSSQIDSFRFERIKVNITVRGRTELSEMKITGLPMSVSGGGKVFSSEDEFEKITLSGPLEIDYSYGEGAPVLSVAAYSAGDSTFGLAIFSPPVVSQKRGRNLALLVDVSASVRDYYYQVRAAAEKCISAAENFSLACFNDTIVHFSGNRGEVSCFLEGITPAYGTDISSALTDFYSYRAKSADALIVITDGFPSVGETGQKMIRTLVESHSDIPLYIIAIGEDVNGNFLEKLARITGGSVIYIPPGAEKSTVEDEVSRYLLPYLTRKPYEVKRVEFNGKPVEFYPPRPIAYGGIACPIVWAVEDSLSGKVRVKVITNSGEEFSAEGRVPPSAGYVQRLWARARVDFLLDRIASEGEKKEWVDEIIALSKRFTFVTPYTAFLAAPRAVLRPRVIQPRDPKLVIDAPYAVRVVVEMPWGERIIAQKNPKTGLWEARFLVPQNVRDGEYYCTLIITDKAGSQWRQRQKFVVDTKPPQLKAKIEPQKASPGTRVLLKVFAPQDTRTILAKLPNGKTLSLHYSGRYKASVAEWVVPSLPPGKYKIRFVATDFAGNQQETAAEITISQ